MVSYILRVEIQPLQLMGCLEVMAEVAVIENLSTSRTFEFIICLDWKG